MGRVWVGTSLGRWLKNESNAIGTMVSSVYMLLHDYAMI